MLATIPPIAQLHPAAQVAAVLGLTLIMCLLIYCTVKCLGGD